MESNLPFASKELLLGYPQYTTAPPPEIIAFEA